MPGDPGGHRFTWAFPKTGNPQTSHHVEAMNMLGTLCFQSRTWVSQNLINLKELCRSHLQPSSTKIVGKHWTIVSWISLQGRAGAPGGTAAESKLRRAHRHHPSSCCRVARRPVRLEQLSPLRSYSTMPPFAGPGSAAPANWPQFPYPIIIYAPRREGPLFAVHWGLARSASCQHCR